MSGHHEAASRADRLLAQVAGIVAEVTGLDPTAVQPQCRFVDDLRVDSLAMVEILEGAGVRLGVRIEDEDVRGFVRVGDLVDYLAQRTR